MALDEVVEKVEKEEEVKKPKMYVVTAAQTGTKPANFYSSLKQYKAVKEKEGWDVELVVGKSVGSSIKEKELDMHPSIEGDTTIDQLLDFEDEPKFNRKIGVKQFDLRGNLKNPEGGLGEYVHADTSAIFISPKQRVKYVPNSNNKLPKALITTGAVTEPNYANRGKQNKKAEHDHILGAIVVEVIDEVSYHFRNVRALKNGSFYDLGVRYDGENEPKQERLEALVLGDWHTGDTDPQVRDESFKMIDEYQPKRIILHDFFNGHSVNHHEEGKLGKRAAQYRRNGLSLEEELEEAATELKYFVDNSPKDAEIVVVASNHNEFLDRYIQEQRHVKNNHEQNLKIGSLLTYLWLEEEDKPIKERRTLVEIALNEVYQRMYGKPIPIPGNGSSAGIVFPRRIDDYKIGSRGVGKLQLGTHGDKGPNGRRGTLRSKRMSSGPGVFGHTHSPGFEHNTYVVGTSTHLILEYNAGGDSSWLNTHALVTKDMKVQLVNIIDGQHKTYFGKKDKK